MPRVGRVFLHANRSRPPVCTTWVRYFRPIAVCTTLSANQSVRAYSVISIASRSFAMWQRHQ
jgi:hypothetical protein